MRTKALQFNAVVGIMLALGAFSLNSFAADCPTPRNLDQFRRDHKSKLQDGCGANNPTCRTSVGQISEAVEEYYQHVSSTCGAIGSAAQQIVASGNSNPHTGARQLAEKGKKGMDDLVSENAKVKEKIYEATKQEIATAETKRLSHIGYDNHDSKESDVGRAKKAHEGKNFERSDFTREKLRKLNAEDVKKAAFAPAVGVEAIKALEEDRKLRAKSSADFETQRARVADLEEKFKSNESPSSPDGKKGGGLLDSLANPSMLMGLASLGAGLMQKKNSEGSDVSGATPTAPEKPAQVSGASLAGPEGSAKPDKLDLARETPKAESTSFTPFSGAPLDIPESDVSTKNAFSAGESSQSPSNSSPGLPGGTIDGGGNPADKAASRAPAGEAGRIEEGVGAFSLGGGGAGGGMNFGSSSSDPAAHADDPIRETLQDMAAAVDSNAAALADTSEGQANNETFEGANSEFLFTRVKSAIQRSVKKGHVISGLTAKIR